MSSSRRENFLAVALVINRSRDGPAFVFHYPPEVRPVTSQPEGPVRPKGADEDILLERLGQPLGQDPVAADGTPGKHHHHHHLRHRRLMMDEADAYAAPWERVAGFPTRDLASILTPARSYHKKLFQLSLDPVRCISYPVHVPDDGKWKRGKKPGRLGRAGRAGRAGWTGKPSRLSEDPVVTSAETEPSGVAAADGLAQQQQQQQQHRDGDGWRDEADEEKRSSMTMFNLVFMLNPARGEDRELVDALYHNVVRKVNKAYKYSQQHGEFVWKESKRILLAKERAREERWDMGALWKELMQSFSLAASVRDIYEAVSRNKMATLHLDTPAGVLTPSVQIPAPLCVTDIGAGPPGLWLTTANSFLSQEQLDDAEFLDKNFGLLLLEDEAKIVADLQADRDPAAAAAAAPMVEFARLAGPTLSLHQVCQAGRGILTPGQVRKYAQHFIFWRRAMAVPPLHARDVYVVSPNCDLARLPRAAAEWQRAFPLAPPLPNLLSDMSHAPRPFKTLCPAKAQRPMYLRMLAWLLRGGWVTQLCTFAYVVVWPEILYEVAYEMEAEELAVAAAAAAEEGEQQREEEDWLPSSSPPPPSSRLSSPTLTTTRPTRARPPPSTTPACSPPSPKTLPTTTTTITVPMRPPPPPQPTPAEQAAEQARLERIALKASRQAANRATAHARKTVPLATPHPSLNESPHLSGLSPHVIPDARRATGRESRYLSAIARRFTDHKVRAAWHIMSRYFDGGSALERVALREDMRPKDAWALLGAMSEYLVCTRHW